VGSCPLFLFEGLFSVRPDARLEQIRPMAERVAGSYGFDVFDLQFRREPIGWVLRVVIDLPTRRAEDGTVLVEAIAESIGVDDCQRVSQDLGAVLDVAEAIDTEYTLEVSSPGADRPLRSADDYRRFAGRPAKIVVREAVDNQMHFEGRLRGIEGEDVVLETGRKIKRIPLSRVSRAKLDVEFGTH
jgi:ribosome maturation factor RimP